MLQANNRSSRAQVGKFVAAVSLLLLTAVLAVILGIMVLRLFSIPVVFDKADPLGLVNAVVSGLAFGAVIISLWFQKNELAMQHEELCNSIEQYKKMAEAQESSDKRLFLTAYLNALTTLREMDTAQFEINYALDISYTLAAVSQRRMKLTLNQLLPALHNELASFYKLPNEQGLQEVIERIACAIAPLNEYAAVHSQGVTIVPTDCIPKLETFKQEMLAAVPTVPANVAEKIQKICGSIDGTLHRVRIGEDPPGTMSEWGHVFSAIKMAKDLIIDFLRQEL